MKIERVELNEVANEESWPTHMARYHSTFPFVRGKKVLDAGNGIGYGAALMKVRGGAAEVTGIDIDQDSIQQAEETFGHLGVNYQVHDCEKIDQLPGPFDVIVSFENIEHLSHPELFLAGAAKSLSSDGCLIISTPDRSFSPPFVDGKPTNPYHVTEWYAEEFKAMLEENFSNVSFMCQVESHGATRWKKSHQALKDNLAGLEQIGRYSGMMRIRRSLGQLGLLAKTDAQLVKNVDLKILRMDDYPIVEREVAALYGTPMCHVAVCRNR